MFEGSPTMTIDLMKLQSMLAEQIYDEGGALERLEQTALEMRLLEPETQVAFLKAGAIYRALHLLTDVSENLRAVEALEMPEDAPRLFQTPPEAGESTSGDGEGFRDVF